MYQIKLTTSLFWEYLQFLRRPNVAVKQEEWGFAPFARVFLVRFVFFVISVVLYVFLQMLPLRKLDAVPATDLELVKTLPFLVLLILGTTVIPLGEELMMRLPMRISMKNILISFFAGTIVWLFFTQLQAAKLYHFHQISFEWRRIIPPGVIAVVSLAYLYAAKMKPGYAQIFFGVYVYLMAILFGVLHSFVSMHSPLDVLYAIPGTFLQISSGVFYSFVRMKYGLRMSVVTHVFWNFIAIVGEKLAVL